jgi:hypothetical protein
MSLATQMTKNSVADNNHSNRSHRHSLLAWF